MDAMSSSTSISSTDIGRNCLYAFTTRQDSEESPDVVIDILRVLSHDLYCLLDLGFTLS